MMITRTTMSSRCWQRSSAFPNPERYRTPSRSIPTARRSFSRANWKKRNTNATSYTVTVRIGACPAPWVPWQRSSSPPRTEHLTRETALWHSSCKFPGSFRDLRGTIAIVDLLAGSINTEYGVFRNECCGDEYVLYRGIKFPNCKKHRDIVTRWHLVFPISMGPLQG